MTDRRSAQSVRRLNRTSRRELILLLGGAMTAPRGLRAQQKALRVIGYLIPGVAGTECTVCGRIPRGTGRNGLSRRTKFGDRIPAGGGAL
jgi:hypothetical protein